MSSAPPQPSTMTKPTIKPELSEYTKSLIKTKQNTTEPLCQEFYDTLNSDLIIANAIAVFKTDGLSQSEYVAAVYKYFEASVTAYDPFIFLNEIPLNTAFLKLTGKELTSQNDFESSEMFPPDVDTNLNRYLLMMYRNLGLLARYQQIFRMKTSGSELAGVSGLMSNLQTYCRPEVLKNLANKLSEAVGASQIVYETQDTTTTGTTTDSATTSSDTTKPLNTLYPIFAVYNFISDGIKDAHTPYADPVFTERCDDIVKCIEEMASALGVEVPKRFSLGANQLAARLKFNAGDMKTAYKLTFKTALEAEKQGYPTIAYHALGISALAISFGALGPTFTWRQGLQIYDKQNTLLPLMKPFLPQKVYKSYSQQKDIQIHRDEIEGELDLQRPVHIIDGGVMAKMAPNSVDVTYTCDVCGEKKYKMNKCARCQGRFYCCVECQRKDWPEHKKECTAK